MSAARVARRPSGRDRVVAYPPKVLVCPVGNVQSASDLNAPKDREQVGSGHCMDVKFIYYKR